MRATLPLEVLHAIRLPTWHALLVARGRPRGLTPTASHAQIASALATTDLPVPLARAIFTILAFAIEAARSDLYAAAAALAHPTTSPPWSDATSPADLVAALLASAAAATKDDAIAEVLAAAQILRDRAFRPRATYVYVGAPGDDAHIGEPTQYVKPLAAAVTAWGAKIGFGAVHSVSAHAVSGVLHYEIAHEDRATTLFVDGAPRVVRPLRSHAMTYEPAARWLAITTDCMEAVTPLATIAGAVFFDSPRHFLDTPAIDLWKLQELGAAALSVRELAAKVTVSAINATWQSGKPHTVTLHGPDFFKALDRYKIRIEGGGLDLFTLRGKLPANDGGPAQCDVVLRPPHLLSMSEPEAAPLMREFLDYAHITNPEPRLHDFFSLQPWNESPAGWIAAEGEAGFAQLRKSGLLKADPSNRAVTPPDHPHAARTATAYPLRGKKYLAWSPDPTVAPFVVSEESLVTYVLQFGKLGAVVAAALGLDGPAAKLDDDGVLYCGRRALGPTYVLVFLLTRRIRPATVERLREAAGHGHAVLVAPAGRMERHGLHQIAMPKLAGPWQPLVGAIVRALHLEAHVDTTLYAPADARIVLHRATMRAWVDGVKCLLTESLFRLLDFFLQHPGEPSNTKDIAEYVAKGRQHEDTTRKAIDSLGAAVEKSFKASKKKPPADLASFITQPRRGHYVLNVVGYAD
jgi:hypothetical protein